MNRHLTPKPKTPRRLQKLREAEAAAVPVVPPPLPGLPLPGGQAGVAECIAVRLRLQKALADQNFQTLTSIEVRGDKWVIITRGENPGLNFFQGYEVYYQPSNGVLTHFYRKNQ